MSTTDSYGLVEDADPALIYLIFTWLRKRYADHPNADAVIGRLVEVSGRPKVAKLMKEGQADVVVVVGGTVVVDVVVVGGTVVVGAAVVDVEGSVVSGTVVSGSVVSGTVILFPASMPLFVCPPARPLVAVPQSRDHSARSASTGFTDAARRAGTRLATAATATKITAPPMNKIGSSGRTP